MKRLYVRPPFRGDKIGRELAERIVQEARRLGYRSMRLDSHPPTMGAAVKMYRTLGFSRSRVLIRWSPCEGLIYMELASGVSHSSHQRLGYSKLQIASAVLQVVAHARENSLASLSGSGYYAVNPMATSLQDA